MYVDFREDERRLRVRVRDGGIDELLRLGERMETHLHEETSFSGDAIAKRNVVISLKKACERLVVAVLHGRLDQILDWMTEQFMVEFNRIAFDDTERLEASDAFADGWGR